MDSRADRLKKSIHVAREQLLKNKSELVLVIGRDLEGNHDLILGPDMDMSDLIGGLKFITAKLALMMAEQKRQRDN